jgi:hypothetical protein
MSLTAAIFCNSHNIFVLYFENKTKVNLLFTFFVFILRIFCAITAKMPRICILKDRSHSNSFRWVNDDDIKNIRKEQNKIVSKKSMICSSCRLYLKRKYEGPEDSTSSSPTRNKMKKKKVVLSLKYTY